MKQKVYIDTSVIGGCFDPEFEEWSNAIHIGIATVYQVNVLASWNFKHIVNLDKIRMYNSVNLKNGYAMIEIRTPREILKTDYDEKE